MKTYKGHEDFYYTLFFSEQQMMPQSSDMLEKLLDHIPKWLSLQSEIFSYGNNSSISSTLLDASFWVDFTENSSKNGMLGAIDGKIKDLKQKKCNIQESFGCYGSDISNIYLPTLEELYNENIYLDRQSVKIETIKDEFEYQVSWTQSSFRTDILQDRDKKIESLKAKFDQDFPVVSKYYKNGNWDFTNSSTEDMKTLFPNGNINLPSLDSRIEPMQSARAVIVSTIFHFQYITYVIEHMGNQPSIESIVSTIKEVTNYDKTIYIPPTLNITKEEFLKAATRENTLTQFIKELNVYKEAVLSSNISYTLRYKKNNYTIEEARAVLEKKAETLSGNIVVLTQDGWIMFNCNDSTKSYKWKLKCTALSAISTTLWAYYADKESYPDSLDDLNQNYLPKWQLPEWFKENFSYKKISNEDFEIRYIGTPDEEATTPSSQKSDYKALMSGSTLPEIPAIFTHVPSDSMVLYVKNPTNLLDILDQKSNTTNRLSGFDVSQSIKEFITTFFEIEDFTKIQKNLKHEMAIVVNNLDATSPDIVLMISEADKDALSPTLKTRVIGSKDGYIFIASSKQSIEKITGLTPEKSMKNAPDFQYVWWKKSGKVNDALMFVGDEFFEKILTLETYITHYRKYRDYGRLSSLQELVWAYNDAFGKNPTSLVDLTSLGLSTLTGGILDEYTITDGIVSHKNIGSLKSINTLPEANYDLSHISRTELEDYKSNVLKYRDIWRSSLDPMGIVLNRYGDGIEMDFFMTPIPSLDGDLKQIQDFTEWLMKDKLSFVTNPHIRIGLISFIFWMDGKKIQEKFNSNKEYQSGFDEMNKEVLDGKNIFDFLTGEAAFSLWGLDSDIFDGWNIEKVDLYGSVQVTNEEKWKEFIDIIRKRVLKEIGDSSNDETNMIKGFLAKPLIEDYKAKKIYYVEWLPIPFIWKIGFAYTFVDDFFMIAPNRSTIKRVIDTSLVWDIRKSQIIDRNGFETGTLFATVFDGESLSQNLRWLYDKNQSYITRYARYLDEIDTSDMNSLLGTYYSQEDQNRRLGKTQKPFSYTLGAVSIGGNLENFVIKIDENQLKNLTGSTIQSWENLKNEEKFPKEILTPAGISLQSFLSLSQKWDILWVALISHLERAFSGDESLFRNTTFWFSLGNNEVGFSLKVFREWDNSKKSGESFIFSQRWVLGGILMFLLIWGGCIWVVLWKRRRVPQIVNMSPVSEVMTTPDLSSELIVPMNTEISSSIISPDPLITDGPRVSWINGEISINSQTEKSI